MRADTRAKPSCQFLLDAAQSIAEKLKSGRGSSSSSGNYMPAHVDYSSWSRPGTGGGGGGAATGNYSGSAVTLNAGANGQARNGRQQQQQQPEANLPPGPTGMLEEDDDDDEEDLIAVERGEARR